MLKSVIIVTLLFAGGYAGFFVLYQLVLAFIYFILHEKNSGSSQARKKFVVIIPAHNEELMIGTALDSWKKVQYPHDHFEVYVIADNCSDQTAEIVRAYGAACLERHDSEKKGKGQALAWALSKLSLDSFDAVVFVDADTTVSPKFLAAMNTRLISGAKVIQGYDGVLNPDDSMMTRLMHITNLMKNLLFNHSKSKLGFSVQLMGTGMCLDRSILQQIGWKAFSIGEDHEQFSYLAQAGIRVEFEPSAIGYAQEASSFGQAYTQRVRWASARIQLLGVGGSLLMKGLKKYDFRLMDAGLSYFIPNYAMLANITLVCLIVSIFIEFTGRSFFISWFSFLLAAQVLYFAMGVALSELSVRALCSIGFAPVFLLWKMVIDLIAILHLRRPVWTRTRRLTARRRI